MMKTNPRSFLGGISLLMSLWLAAAAHAADKPLPVCNRLRFGSQAGSEQAMMRTKLEGSQTSRTEGYITLAMTIECPAWDVVKNHPDCGLYEEGQQSWGKPQFSADGRIIPLKSSMPGGWFRYSLDGTPPTRTRGYVYYGAFSVQPGIQVPAIAYKSGMADSTVTTL